MSVRKLTLGAAISALAALYICNYLFTPILFGPESLEVYFRPHCCERFDSENWKLGGWTDEGMHGSPSRSYGTRYKMVDDLILSRISVGMKAERVKDLIGNPDAGIVDRKSLLAAPDPYGGHKLDPAKRILESRDDIAIWAYYLAYQHQYPAQSILFPNQFSNFGQWKLLVEIRNGKVYCSKIAF